MIDKYILKEKVMQVPLVYKKEIGFKEYTGSVLTEYLKLLKRYGCDNDVINRVTSFKNYYIQMIECYYKGQHSKAYQKFKTALKQLNVEKSLILHSLDEKEFFRARINLDSKSYSAAEMWHIPFNERGMVSTERFSFPGLPCLYFGASSYACWIELDKPEYRSFQVAKVEVCEENINDAIILDIGMVPYKVEKEIDNGKNIGIESYLLSWPIIAMSMVQTNSKTDRFKPEYIFPQFLLEYTTSGWLKNKKVIGIRYASTKITSKQQYTTGCRTYICYAFPTTYVSDLLGEDERLKRYFNFKGTISGSDQVIFSDAFARDRFRTVENFRKKYEKDVIFADDNKGVSYDVTRFAEIEYMLR